MNELARFLRDLLLHPELRRHADQDLRTAAEPYALSSDELQMLENADPQLLDAIGKAVRNEPSPHRPAAVERIEAQAPPSYLDPAHLWLRLAPFQELNGSVHYSVGVASAHSTEGPTVPLLDGNPLPVVDLDISVQPSLRGTSLSFSSSMLPRGVHLPAPQRARTHRSIHDAEVQAQVEAARTSEDLYVGVLSVIDALTTPGGTPWSPSEHQRGPAEVTIVGTGMVFPDQVTVEAERAIRRAREVLVADTGIATLEWMRARCPLVTPLLQSGYVEGDSRLHTYHHFVASTVVAALRHSPVVFAMSGHPIVSAYAPFLLADTARAFGLSVEIQPGISSFAAIVAALEIDPLLTGLQLHEATDLVLQKRPLQPDLPVLVVQVGTLGTLLHSDQKRNEAAFEPLRAHLLRFFPATHQLTAIHISPHPMVPHTQHVVALEDLCKLGPELHAGFSLWVPAATDRPLADARLAAGLSDVEVLREQLRAEDEQDRGQNG